MTLRVNYHVCFRLVEFIRIRLFRRKTAESGDIVLHRPLKSYKSTGATLSELKLIGNKHLCHTKADSKDNDMMIRYEFICDKHFIE